MGKEMMGAEAEAEGGLRPSEVDCLRDRDGRTSTRRVGVEGAGGAAAGAGLTIWIKSKGPAFESDLETRERARWRAKVRNALTDLVPDLIDLDRPLPAVPSAVFGPVSPSAYSERTEQRLPKSLLSASVGQHGARRGGLGSTGQFAAVLGIAQRRSARIPSVEVLLTCSPLRSRPRTDVPSWHPLSTAVVEEASTRPCKQVVSSRGTNKEDGNRTSALEAHPFPPRCRCPPVTLVLTAHRLLLDLARRPSVLDVDLRSH